MSIEIYQLLGGMVKLNLPEIQGVPYLFANISKVLEGIPEDERKNLFYTLAHCEDRKTFTSQHVLAWDIDSCDMTRADEYLPIFAGVVGVNASEVGVVHSGHGIHFLIHLSSPITYVDFFKTYRKAYKKVCTLFGEALFLKSLPHKVDASIFDPMRVMRLPQTWNIKKNKPPIMATCKQLIGAAVPFTLDPWREEKETRREAIKKATAARIDRDAILQGCKFIAHCKDTAATLPEPEWYAFVSIMGRVDRELAHTYSKPHPGYSYEECESKLDQAANIPPRTCANIDTLWDGCSTCEFNTRITTPLQIESKEFIATEGEGFHTVIMNNNGPKYTPCYTDLCKKYAQENDYFSLPDSGMVYSWDGKKYSLVPTLEIQSFAQKHFYPPCDNKKANEFLGLILRTNQKTMGEINETTLRKINFQNGFYSMDNDSFELHHKDVFFFYVLPYDYDPEARAPLFEAMLAKITKNNPDLSQFLLEFFGYAISGDDCWIQKALMMIGEGSNGKSTFINIMQQVAGPNNYSSLTLNDIKKENSRHMLNGKLFNVADETPNYGVGDTAVFKTLVSGGEVTGRKLYKDIYTFKNRTKFAFSCNDIPENNGDNSRGFFRRFLIAPFDVEFKDTDKDFDPFIENKIIANELPGIFNLLIAAYKKVRKRGKFIEPEVMVSAKREYVETLDVVGTWLNEHINWDNEKKQDVLVPMKEIYAEYKMWCERSGVKPLSLTRFGLAMKKHPIAKGRKSLKRTNKKQITGYLGAEISVE